MSKKVIDIFPPKDNRKSIEFSVGEKIEEKTAVQERKILFEQDKKINLLESGSRVKRFGNFFSSFKKNRFPFLVLLGPAFLLLVFTISYLTLSSAKIEIWPEGEIVNLTAKLTVKTNQDKIDFALNIIPGQILEKNQTLSDTFSASGKIKKEKKAEGVIRAYNAFSTSAQALLANTRFVSADGKIFKTLARTTIPGAWYNKGKLIPGEIDIRVAADQPGPDYNIASATFSIPGFAGTEKYTKFYGKSSEQMTGGIAEEVVQITDSDLRKAEDVLTKKAKEEAETSLINDLKAKDSSGKINFETLADTIQTNVTDRFTEATTGAEMDKFEFRVGVKSTVLTFKKEDLENFVKEFISAQLPQSKRTSFSSSSAPYSIGLDEKSLKIAFVPELTNISSNRLMLNLTISDKIYSDLDIPAFQRALQGKTLTEATSFLKNQTGINNATVVFWPFWVKKAPDNEQKIKIILNLDQIK